MKFSAESCTELGLTPDPEQSSERSRRGQSDEPSSLQYIMLSVWLVVSHCADNRSCFEESGHFLWLHALMCSNCPKTVVLKLQGFRSNCSKQDLFAISFILSFIAPLLIVINGFRAYRTVIPVTALMLIEGFQQTPIASCGLVAGKINILVTFPLCTLLGSCAVSINNGDLVNYS